MKCHINNRKSKASLTQTWIALRKPARYLQLRSFTFFGTTWSLLSTILNPASWWLSQSFDSYAAAFSCTDVGPNCTGNSGILASGKTRMAPKPSKTATARWLAWNSKTMPLFMKCQMNNQKSQSFPKTNLDHLRKTSPYLQLRSFTFFCTTWSLLRTILDSASWWLSQSCDSYAAAFCCTNVGPNCTGNSGILVSGKIRMAPRPSKTTTARWPCWKLTDVPVAVKCQINNQLKPKLPQLKPESPWGRLLATYNFAASPFLHYMISTQDHFRPC